MSNISPKNTAVKLDNIECKSYQSPLTASKENSKLSTSKVNLKASNADTIKPKAKLKSKETEQINYTDFDQALDLVSFPYLKTEKDKNGNEKIKGLYAHVDNLKHLLEQYRITIRYNVILNKAETIIHDSSSMLSDNEDAEKLELLSSLCAINSLSISRLQQQITSIANTNPYNPVLEYAISTAWDGIDRIQLICDAVITAPSIKSWKETAITKFMYSAIGAALNSQHNKFVFKGILVFQGEQGIGKTPFFKLLTGDLVKYFKDGLELNPNNKDTVITALECWIVELGEIDSTTRKADVAVLKAFLTKYRDTFRPPYAQTNTNAPRRTMFCGSVNPTEFLSDPTGNDRFWTVAVIDFLLDDLESINKQQLWAQVYENVTTGLKKNKHIWTLTDPERETMRETNKDFKRLTPIEEVLNGVFLPVINNPIELHANATNICKLLNININAKDRITVIDWLKNNFGAMVKNVSNGFYIPIPEGISDADITVTSGIKRVKSRSVYTPEQTNR